MLNCFNVQKNRSLNVRIQNCLVDAASPIWSGSTATVWSWSTGCKRGDSWATRQCIAIIGTPQVTDETREAMCQILAWDFKQMEAGKFDLLNHLGNFHSLGSAREGLGGSDIPARGAFMYWKGDMEAHAYSHYLTKTRRYFKCLQCCDFCLGTSDRRCPELSWADVTLRALWRSTLTLTDDSDPSPWVRVPRFQKDRRLLDLLHLVHLGTMRDVIASSIVDALDDGTLAAFYGMQGALPDQILHKLSHHAQAWATSNGFQLDVGTLTMHRLGRTNANRTWPFAVLDSRIKAAKCRVLLAFATFIMCRLAASQASALDQRQRLHAKVRASCLWALDTALSIFSTNRRVVMVSTTVSETVWLCRLHSACYQFLASECLRQGRLLYKNRPKTHYFCHMIDHHEQTGICLLHVSTFGDEDFMHKTRTICRACHGSTYMKAWARRYALKRALQWQDMRKWHGAALCNERTFLRCETCVCVCGS